MSSETPIGAGSRPASAASGVRGWRRADPWAFLALTVSWLVLMLRQVPCLAGGDRYQNMCYSDIPALYYWRGLKDGKVPFLDADLEYPVLTGGLMELSRRIAVLLGARSAPGVDGQEAAQAAGLFVGVNAVLLFALFGVLVWAHLRFHRPWDALMIAASPAVMTVGLINWDALVVALTALSLLAWSRRRPVWSGVWLGLGVAAKLYPLLLMVGLAVLCLRSARLKQFWLLVAGAVGSWLAVNLPVYLIAAQGWLNFWKFNVDRGADLGSIWYALYLAGIKVESVSTWVAVLMVVGTAGICAVLLFAPRRPRVAAGAFLVVALFLMVNKVYSPQFVLWLLPLLVLARPKWLDWAVFSVAELIYFGAVWMHLAAAAEGGGFNDQPYMAAIALRIGVQLWLCGRVVADIFNPSRDPVRAGGLDDPDGGVFDGAGDASWLHRLRPARAGQ